MRKPDLNVRYKLIEDRPLDASVSIPAGEIGTLQFFDADIFGVVLEKYFPKLEAWHNRIEFSDDWISEYGCESLEELFWMFFEEVKQ